MKWDFKPVRVQWVSISLIDVKLIFIALLSLKLFGCAP